MILLRVSDKADLSRILLLVFCIRVWNLKTIMYVSSDYIFNAVLPLVRLRKICLQNNSRLVSSPYGQNLLSFK